MKKENEKKLKKNAIIGFSLMFFSFILIAGVFPFFEELVGTFFIIVITLILLIYGMYLLFPYLKEIGDPNKPWNKKW